MNGQMFLRKAWFINMEKGNINSSDRYSLQGLVFRNLREDILSGKYKENDELKEVAIGRNMGVSRTPVREALRQLELEGLVRIIPNKGAYVIGISHKDLKDIYVMRSRLEGLCARWATQNASPDTIEQLEENVDLTEFHISKQKYEKVLELDNEFHNILYDMAGSKMLYRTLSDFHHYLEVIRKKTLSSPDRVIHSVKEHRDIVEAIKNGNKDKAEQLTILHIKNTIKNIEVNNLL